MIIDISPLLLLIAHMQWTTTVAMDTARELAEAARLIVDHDVGAGETWIRLIRDTDVQGFVHTLRPLIAAEPSVVLAARPDETSVVLSTSLSAKRFTATRDALEAAFPERSQSSVLQDPFSMEDLWFASV